MPRGHSLSVYARFSGKKRTSVYISREKAIIIRSKHDTTMFFPHYNLGKLIKQLARKARVDTEPGYRTVLMPPGYPIILVKSNNFSMVAVSVNWSITVE